MKLTLDLVNRLLETIHTEPKDQPGLRHSIVPKINGNSPKAEIKSLQYLYASKVKDFAEFQSEINSAIERLGPIIEREQRFFGELAFDLLANYWVLQKHHTNSYGNLFVNYGFRFGIINNN